MRSLAVRIAVLLLSVLVWTLTGCASATQDEVVDAPLQIDPAFSPEERAAIVDANARWDAVARPWSGAGWRIELGPPPSGQNGWCDPDTRTITVPHHTDLPSSRPTHQLRDFAILVTHELGHARGLEHTCADGVMQKCEGWSGPSSPAITSGDIAECERVGACHFQ